MSAAIAALRAVLAVLALGASAACNAARDPTLTAATDFALGWEGELDGPLLLADCTPSPETVAPLFATMKAEGRPRFRAAATGDLTLRCGERDVWVVRVLEPARFAVSAPATLAAGERASAILEAFAAGGQRLRLGSFSDIEWRTTGAVREAAPLPHDFIGPAIQLHSDVASLSIEGTAPGVGEVTAVSWRGRRVDASTSITVSPGTADPGASSPARSPR